MELSIVIVSYNTKELLRNCLRSILKNSKGITYEIIVVDNASTDGSPEETRNLQNRYKNIKLIKNNKNLGFGKANNMGIRKAKGEFVLLLNSDTLIEGPVLRELVDWMKKHEKAGVATCALRNKDNTLQGTGGNFPTLLRIFSWMFFLDDIPFLDSVIKPFHPMHEQSPFYKGSKLFLHSKKVDWVTAAFMMVRRKVFETSGLFDEEFFMYTEEVDLCYRIKKKGWEVWYKPDWSIIHFGAASSTREFPILSEYKGVKLYFKKHEPSWKFPLLRLFLKAGAFLRIFIFGILKGKEAARTYAKAFVIA